MSNMDFFLNQPSRNSHTSILLMLAVHGVLSATRNPMWQNGLSTVPILIGSTNCWCIKRITHWDKTDHNNICSADFGISNGYHTVHTLIAAISGGYTVRGVTDTNLCQVLDRLSDIPNGYHTVPKRIIQISLGQTVWCIYRTSNHSKTNNSPNSQND